MKNGQLTDRSQKPNPGVGFSLFHEWTGFAVSSVNSMFARAREVTELNFPDAAQLDPEVSWSAHGPRKSPLMVCKSSDELRTQTPENRAIPV